MAAFADQNRQTNIASLDALRGVACLMVVLGHLAKEEYIFDIKGSGQLGVMIFFVLCGFLMAHLYTHERIGFSSFTSYALRRIFRILPAYLFVAFASYAIYKIYPAFAYPIDLTALIGMLELTTQISVFWTIPVEIKFYAFFPLIWLILCFIKSDRWKFVLTAIVFVALLKLDIPGTRLTLTKHIEFFIGGMAACYLSYLLDTNNAWKRHLINLFFIISCGLVILLIPQVFLHVFKIEHHMWDDSFFIAPIFAICVAFCARITGLVQKVFGNRFMVFIGTISYSLYLVHYPCLMFVKNTAFFAGLPGFFQVIIALIAAGLIATFVYMTIESPLRRTGFILSQKFSSHH